MKIITSEHLRSLISETGLRKFNGRLLAAIEEDFLRWEQFRKSPRHALHYPHGVMELMPWADDEIYTFKYVNGHARTGSDSDDVDCFFQGMVEPMGFEPTTSTLPVLRSPN